MADRTVSVKLKADVDAYNRSVLEAKTTTEGLQRSVVVLERDVKELTPETVKASKATELLGVESGKAKTQTKQLGDELGKTKTQTTGLGEESTKTRARIVDLGADIVKTKAALAEMGTEFQRTGQINVTELDRLSRSLRELERAKVAMGKLVPAGGGDSGRSRGGLLDFALDEWLGRLAKGTSSAIGSGIESAAAFAKNHKIAAAIIAGIVVSAPAIGAAVNAAVLLGVGGGALAVGIAAAARDSRVSGAFSEMFRNVADEFTMAAGPLVAPLVNGAKKFGDAFADMLPGIERGMSRLAPVVDHLVDGVIGFVDRIGPGFSKAFAAAIPLLDQVADDLPLLGAGIGKFLELIASGGPGAASFFHDLIVFTNAILINLGASIGVLTKVYAGFTGIAKIMSGDAAGALDIWRQYFDKGKISGDSFKGALEDVAAAAGGATGPIGSAGDATARLVGSFRDAIREAGFFTTALDNVNGGNIALATSQIGAQSALDRFKEAMKESHGSLDISTEKGRAARQAAIDLALATGDVAQKTYEQSGSSSQGAAALGKLREAMINTGVQSGLTRQAAEALADEYLRIPPSVQTQVTAPGLAQTKADAAEAYRGLDALDGKTANTYTFHYVKTFYEDGRSQMGNSRYGRNEPMAKGGLRKAQVGMFIPPSDPGTVLTGEPQTGGEWLIPARGIDTGRAAMLGKAAMSNYGLDVVPRQAPGYAAFANSRPMGYGGTMTVAHEHRVIVQEPSGRRLAELVIEDGRNGGPINTYVRQVASR